MALFSQVRWFKMGADSPSYTELTSDDNYIVHSNGSLSILDTDEQDEGTYWVEVSNSAGTASEEIEIELIQKTGKFRFKFHDVLWKLFRFFNTF